MKMNPEWKAKWLTALRSGDYEQCTGKLHEKDDGFCCLGVLCDIYPGGRWEEGPDENSVEMVSCHGSSKSSQVLPHSLSKELGIDNSSVLIDDKGADNWLAALNDAGASFEEIADIIEEQL